MPDMKGLETYIELMGIYQGAIAEVAEAADHAEERAPDVRSKIEEARQNGDLPPELERAWEELRNEGDRVMQRVQRFRRDAEEEHPDFGPGNADTNRGRSR